MDRLEAALAGEFALQAGRLDLAADYYLTAAQLSGRDSALSERATRLALLDNDLALAERGLALWTAQSPHALAARGAAAVVALRRNDVDAAHPILASLMTDPDPEAGKTAAGALLSAGSNPEAVSEVLGRLLEAGQLPSQAVVWQELGKMVARLADTELAGKMVDAAIRQFPGEPRVVLLQARQLAITGEEQQALRLLSSLHEHANEDVDLRNALAVQYEAMAQWALGASVMELGPQDGDAYALQAVFLVKLQDRAGLSSLYEKLSHHSGRYEPGRRLLLGKLAEYLELNDQALDWYRSVPGGNERIEARFRSVLVLTVAGRIEQAIEQVRAMQVDAMLPASVRRDAYLLEAELHQREEAVESQLRALNGGLAAFADDSALLYARALCWERSGNTERAEADLRTLLAADPTNAAALNALGYMLADRTSRYQEALELISRALLSEPEDPAIIDSHGWVLFQLGRLDDACAALRRAWSLHKDAEIGAHLAEVLLVLGHADEARVVFERARSIDPEHRTIQLLQDRLGP